MSLLAYFDSFQGLVPCRVIMFFGKGKKCQSVAVQYTANRGPYKKGDTQTWPASQIVPRDCVRRKKHKTLILPYDWWSRSEAGKRNINW